MCQEPTEISKQPIRTRYLVVTGYQPIREQYFLIQSVPGMCLHVPLKPVSCTFYVEIIHNMYCVSRYSSIGFSFESLPAQSWQFNNVNICFRYEHDFEEYLEL
eukprot:sb/3478201/